jgi:peptidoglycan/LPS O-acetylase OafA/YrhL
MQRLDELDGIRGLAITMVVLCHTIIALWSDDLGPVGDAFEWMFASGVDLFFVLSGFLISGILLDARGKSGVFKSFYMRRVLRIIPLYYSVLIFYGVILQTFFPEGHGFGGPWLTHPIGNFLFFANFQSFIEGVLPLSPNSATWSLAVEEHFYLIWPALVLLTAPKKYVPICVSVFIFALLVRYILVFNGANDNQILIFTFARMDCFAIGGLLAYAFRDEELWGRVSKLFPVGVILGLGLSCIAYPIMSASEDLKRIIQPLEYTFACIGFASLIGFVLKKPMTMKGVFRSRILMSFGRYSYGIYLTNLGVIYGLILLMGDPVSLLGIVAPFVFVPLVFTACWVVGKLLFHSIEQPFLLYKVHFPYGQTEDKKNGH